MEKTFASMQLSIWDFLFLFCLSAGDQAQGLLPLTQAPNLVGDDFSCSFFETVFHVSTDS